MKLNKAALLSVAACASTSQATAAAQDRPASSPGESDQDVSPGFGIQTGLDDQIGRACEAGFRF